MNQYQTQTLLCYTLWHTLSPSKPRIVLIPHFPSPSLRASVRLVFCTNSAWTSAFVFYYSLPGTAPNPMPFATSGAEGGAALLPSVVVKGQCRLCHHQVGRTYSHPPPFLVKLSPGNDTGAQLRCANANGSW
jgi:hypothetical protein